MNRQQIESALASGISVTLRMADSQEYTVPHPDDIWLPPNAAYVIVHGDDGHFTVLPLLTMTGLRAKVTESGIKEKRSHRNRMIRQWRRTASPPSGSASLAVSIPDLHWGKGLRRQDGAVRPAKSPRTGDYITMVRGNIGSAVQRAMSDTPVVLLNGARQTGKTTLAQAMADTPACRRGRPTWADASSGRPSHTCRTRASPAT